MSVLDETWDRPVCEHCKQIVLYGEKRNHRERKCLESGLASIRNNNDLADKIKQTIKHEDTERVALGYLRYEALRKLDIRQFANLTGEALKGPKGFDALVDELVMKP